jgi:hypothetical protein
MNEVNLSIFEITSMKYGNWYRYGIFLKFFDVKVKIGVYIRYIWIYLWDIMINYENWDKSIIFLEYFEILI